MKTHCVLLHMIVTAEMEVLYPPKYSVFILLNLIYLFLAWCDTLSLKSVVSKSPS